MSSSQLPPEMFEECLEMICKWRVNSETRLPCPKCHKHNLEITDHSARPHTEWYRLLCKDCGLDHFVSFPLGSSSSRSET